MVGLMMWSRILPYTYTWKNRVGKCISLFYRFSRDPPPSKQILQGCNVPTANYSTTPQQHDVRMFIQLFITILPIHLVDEQFLKFSYLSHILHLANTRCLIPLNKNVIKLHFSASEYTGAARDLMCCHTQEHLIQPGCLHFSACKVKYSCQPFERDTQACNLMALPPLLIQQT